MLQYAYKQGDNTMCGIVGYVGDRSAQDVLISGLKRLEYRGYDSAGIATLDDNSEPHLAR